MEKSDTSCKDSGSEFEDVKRPRPFNQKNLHVSARDLGLSKAS